MKTIDALVQIMNFLCALIALILLIRELMNKKDN